MARGDGGKAVFEEDKDRFDFLERLGKICGSHGWRIHAWVLMGNHFHLLVETPEPNLVTGMKTLLGGFSQAWNRRRKRMGHVLLLRKSDPRKAAVAILLRKRTAVANGWIPERLAMGHASNVSRLAKDESAF